jgi:type II secretory pathway pseudopilin PulG
MSNDTRALLRDTRGLSMVELVITLALFAMVMAGVVTTWGKAQEAYFIGSETAEVQQNVRAAIDFMVREIRSTGRDATVCAFDYTTGATTDCDSSKVTTCTNKLSGFGSPAWQTNNGVGGAGCTGLYAIPFARATANTLRIRSDRNGNGRIAGRGNATTADRGEEDVLYELATGNPPCTTADGWCITRDDGTGPQAMVAVDITGLTFTYYPRANFGPCAGVANPCNIPFPPTGPPTQADADNIGRIRIRVQAQQDTAGTTVSRTLITEVTLKNRS